MFNIPSRNAVTMTSEKAHSIIERLGGGSLLEGMEFMNKAWDNQSYTEAFFDFFETEANAYNVVFTEMKKLFG
jgi:hypothetical protein|tara:strand:- start:134 stop:352 length:219 start_codon:yes stop_codon:yes gene_type:complete